MTAERFAPDWFGLECGARLYRSGDVVRYRGAGAVEYVGRVDEQVKLRGYRIELGEVEAALRRCAGVHEAAVALRSDGAGKEWLVGYVTTNRMSKAPSGRELREYLRGQLPEYMIPSVFVFLDDLPLMTNGKLDRRALPAPDVRAAEDIGGYLGPRTPVEEIVVGIFENLLKLNRVGRKDNFFELGGHSLLATQVISRVRNSFGLEIGVGGIFMNPTAEGLSRRIEVAMRAGEKVEAPPLVRVEREGRRGGSFPLSFAQQRLWFIDQLYPASPLYINQGIAMIEGELNLEAFERMINEIVRRHETLRTRFEIHEGEPAQVILEWEFRRLDVVDLTSLGPEERREEVSRITREESGTGFDLGRGPLLRVKVLKLTQDEYVVLYTMHHIVSDAWSMEILIREVNELYRTYSIGSVGEAPTLPELPIQYADFAVWQRAWLQGEALEEKLEYWRRQLAGIEDLALPTDRPRPAMRSYRGGIRHFVVERELTRKLRKLSQREEVTLFMVMLAGFDVLMSRYSGQNDVVVGTDTANRNRAEIEGLIGFFINQLVLRVEVRTEESFEGLLKRVRNVCLEAYAHEDAPFEKLVEELRPERDLSRSPLFQAKLIWQNAPQSRHLDLESKDWLNNGDSAQTASESQMARFDLLVSIVDVGSNLIGSVDYSRDLFEAETIERLMSHYINALRDIVGGIEKSISTLDLLSGAEREQIVVEWNRTETPYMSDRPIHELFAEQAERAPERIALIGGGKLVSYRELNRRANQLGGYLQGLGVGPEVVVGVCLERSVEMIVAILGTLKAGGAYLPLDPEFPAERLEYLLEDAGVRVILTQRSLDARLKAFGRETVLIAEEWERIDVENESAQKSDLERTCEAENLAYVIYTSGSTGKPKGVMVRHQSLVNYSQDICRRLGTAEGANNHNLQFATVSTIAADLGNTCIYPSLLSGGGLHVLSYETAIDGIRFGEYLRHEPIDVLKIVPSHLSGLLRSQQTKVNMLPQKYLILGGEALSYELVDRIRARGESCEVINHYGPTETTIGSLTAKAQEVDVEAGRAMSAPIGTPIANTRSYVLDRDFNLVPVGARGELQISGEGVARGYLGKPDMTAERFMPNPFSQNGGERLYRTGDVVRYLSDGKTEFLGRADDQVKVRGYRVELGEIEAVLTEHRCVRQSVVVAHEDESGDKRIVGYVAAEEKVTVAELKQYARERLPEYMTPETILLLEEIPLTANGKVDRKRLPSLSDALQVKEEGFIRSRDIFEHRLLKIWEGLLDVRPIGVKDSFFDLGGHSILAAIMMAQIKSEFGREAPLYVLFQEGTIERLAAFFKQDASSMSWSCLVEFQSSGPKTPLFFVHPGGGNVHSYYDLARCLGSDRPFYAFQQPGLYKERALFTSIEDLAAYYIEAMKTAQPEGPYFIGGWSFGGLVAFEMARQLFAQDQKVGQLMLLDSSAPISMKEYFGEEYEEDDEDEHKDDATLLLELFGGLGFSEEDLKPYEGDKRIEYILKTGIGMNLFPPDVDIARARNYLELFRTNGRARRKYLPQVYQGSVTLFTPFTQLTLPPSDGTDHGERIARLIHDKGWSELAAGGVRVIEVPGDHGTMVGKPHVETLALRIRECLDEAETIDS
jgi:amino acid adenylation domain-containing protein